MHIYLCVCVCVCVCILTQKKLRKYGVYIEAWPFNHRLRIALDRRRRRHFLGRCHGRRPSAAAATTAVSFAERCPDATDGAAVVGAHIGVSVLFLRLDGRRPRRQRGEVHGQIGLDGKPKMTDATFPGSPVVVVRDHPGVGNRRARRQARAWGRGRGRRRATFGRRSKPRARTAGRARGGGGSGGGGGGGLLHGGWLEGEWGSADVVGGEGTART